MLQIDLDYIPSLQLALQQNGVQALELLRLTHTGDAPLHDLVVRIRAEPAFAPDIVRPVARIDPGGTINLDDLELVLSIERLVGQTEREVGAIHVEVDQGDERLAASRFPVELLACNEWAGSGAPPELLCAFALPNHPAVATLLGAARDLLRQHTGRPDLEGYQSRDPARVLAIAGAVYDAVAALGITYVNPPASFERTGQKVRTPDQILDARMGTCLDITVLLAAALEQCGLHPLIVVIDGHAFPGCWLHEWSFPTATVDDPVPLRKRVDLGEIVVFDSSAATKAVGFAEAVASGRAQLHDEGAFRFTVDVRCSRLTGIRPLPLRSGVTYTALPDEAPAPVAPSLPALPDLPDRPTSEAPATRLDRWKSRLLDLSLNNRLLNHKDGKRVLPVLETDLAALEDALSQGRRLTLAPRPDAPPPPSDTLWLDLPAAELDRRGVELYRTGRAHLQETGANATWLALGFLRWFESPSSQQARLAPLVLLPVTVDRVSVGRPYTVVLSDDDAMVNVTLLKKLAADFGLDTAGYDALPTDEHGLDVGRVLQRFRALVRDVARFEVLPHAVITLYAFKKFLMWLDLEQRTDDLLRSPVVRRLVQGDGELPSLPFLGEASLDAVKPAIEDLSVMDGDSSQLAAIYGALDGNSFVLQGPPGTGKSQTITNLVAAALARDKTVLFVSEKRAALEVVHRRLVSVGLGPFCLEAHSEMASKREIARQLEEPLGLLGTRSTAGWEAHAAELQALRTELNTHVETLHAPGPWGESLFQATSRLIGLRSAPRVPLERAVEDADDLSALRRAVDALAARTAEIGVPSGSRWAFAQARDWSPRWVRDVEAAFDVASEALPPTIEAAGDASEALTLPAPTDLAQLRQLDALLGLLLSTPQPPAALLSAPRAEVDATLDAVSRLVDERSTLWGGLSQRYQPALLARDHAPDARLFERWAGAFFLLAFVVLFFARRRVAALARSPLGPNAAVASDLRDAVAIRELDAAITGHADAGRRLLGHRFQGPDTDAAEVDAVRGWAAEMRGALAVAQGDDPIEGLRRREALIRLATDGADLLADGAPTAARLIRARTAIARLEQALTALTVLLHSDNAGQTDLAALGPHLAGCRASTRELQGHTAWLRAADEARALGLDPLVDRLWDGDIEPRLARDALERCIRERWVEERLDADASLRHFRGIEHDARISRFRELDIEARSLARNEIVARLAARLPDPTAPGEMAVLQREFKKKRAHKPVRTLFAQVPHVLPRLKPCVLMSPLSVARFLDPTLQGFDLVVFDEASQIPPWDAIGAMARGRQVVVVGDSKQLPPTTFFQRGEDDEPDDEDQVDLESILDECVAAGLPSHALRWHYRSRHETLIAFSNHHYYDNRLHTFPTALADVPDLGVKWVHVPGSYDKGRSRTNQAEAEAVVAEISRRATDPELRHCSVGVVTFSMTQQRLIEDLLDAARRDPAVEAGLSALPEPLFVKNLENVQGDERDVMLFSVGYGPDRQGRVSMNFGPLNRTGGERRLNVAITRARRLLVVYSTLRPEQIDLSRTRAIGVRHFKTFLDYAARGPKAIDEALQLDPTADFDSPFEAEVSARLEALGHTVHRQVGCAGYRIDLAVVDPDAPGTYLLGIECDGATYHSARSARDRDRIRASVLEGLGWRLHRIWSTDWWHDPDGELQRVVDAIEAATAAPRRPPVPEPPQPRPAALSGPERLAHAAPSEPPESEVPAVVWPEHAVAWRPTSIGPGGSKEAFDREGARIVAQIEAAAEAGAPLELDEIVREVAASWGFARAGSNVRARIESAARRAGVTVRDGVVWRADQDPVAWAGFRYCEGEASRDLPTVPLREVANAAAWVLQRAVALDEDELCREVASIFGIARSGSRVRERVRQGVQLLVADGVAEQVDRLVRVRQR